MKTCIVDGCENKRHVKIGYCGKHYYKFKTHGDPLGGRRGASPGAPLKWIQENANYQGEDCLTWPFEIGRYGYGSVKHNGKRRVASRVMCEFAHGLPPEEGMDAAHSCGNGSKGCMNPRHLSWKTRAENNKDKIAHGTHRQGESINFAKLTEDQVKFIIEAKGKYLQRELAEMFGVADSCISRIQSGKRWSHAHGKV